MTVDSANNAYVLATIFSLAHPYGTVSILSSFDFDNKDNGSPANGKRQNLLLCTKTNSFILIGVGSCDGTGGADGWRCQHRWTAISGMVAFRNNVGDAELTNWESPASSQIAFSRGDAGFVAINNGDSEWTQTFSVSLADGTYCDAVTGAVADGACSGDSCVFSSLHLNVIS